MCGNAAEMINKSGIAMGGSWNDYGGDVTYQSKQFKAAASIEFFGRNCAKQRNDPIIGYTASELLTAFFAIIKKKSPLNFLFPPCVSYFIPALLTPNQNQHVNHTGCACFPIRTHRYS